MEYEVWVEIWPTREKVPIPGLLGKATAESFEEACKIVMKKAGLFEYYSRDAVTGEPTFWGSPLFQSEKECQEALDT